MKSNQLKKFISCCAAVVLFFGVLPFSVGSKASYSEAQSIFNGITVYKSGSADIQSWVDGALTADAGSSEWYVIALSQYGNYDFSSYERALTEYLAQNNVGSAASKQKYALALIACGSVNSYISEVLNSTMGRQGIMSWIFGLHLLNNGYKSSEYSVSSVKSKLLDLQLSDGGWAVMGAYGDVDTTAMTVQALSPYYTSDSKVKGAVDNALKFLSERQNQSGDFSSYGVNNPESTAQVLVALSGLGIDCERDSRFIKNGNTLLDGIKLYRLSDGSFCHKQGGSSNGTATVQVFYSTVAYLRMKNGESGLYILDNRNPSALNGKSDSSKPTTGNSASSGKPSVTEKTDTGSAGVNKSESTVADKKTDLTGSVSSTNGSTKETMQNTASQESAVLKETDSTGYTSVPSESLENTEGNSDTSGEKEKLGYKVWVCGAIALLTAIALLVLFIKKKNNRKNIIALVLVAVTAVAFTVLTDFKSVNSYYSESADSGDVIGAVTVSVRCDTVPDKSADHIPSDGVIIETQTEIGNQTTAYEALRKVTVENKIHLETEGEGEATYVSGINNIYEFDFGELSGWMCFVNGEALSVSSGEYVLSVGDKVEWLYTCNMGNDLK